MIIKRESFKTWAELKKKALKYEQLGFVCEVRGWADISNNILTVSDGEEETDGEQRADQIKIKAL